MRHKKDLRKYIDPRVGPLHLFTASVLSDGQKKLVFMITAGVKSGDKEDK